MFADEIDVERVLKLSTHDVADYCDFLDAETLLKAIDEKSRKFDRKGLCKYLGIGESTLSGWLKTDRIPTSAKNAFVLLHVVEKLSLRIRRLRHQLHGGGFPEDGIELKILKNGDKYQICAFKEDERGLTVGEVVADGIANIETAWLLAGSKRSLEHSGNSRFAMEYMVDHFTDSYDREEHEWIDGMEQTITEIALQGSLVNELDLWNRAFGNRHDELEGKFAKTETHSVMEATKPSNSIGGQSEGES